MLARIQGRHKRFSRLSPDPGSRHGSGENSETVSASGANGRLSGDMRRGGGSRYGTDLRLERVHVTYR